MERDIWLQAEKIAHDRGLDRMLVIDADVHHLDVIRYLAPYMDQPWRQALERAPFEGFLKGNFGDRSVAGRIKPQTWMPTMDDAVPPTAVTDLVRDLTRFGIDYSVVFPNDLLSLGLHPDPTFEVAVARAYARWLTEQVLPHEPRLLGMLYLPYSDPKACVDLVTEFGGKKGVVGWMVTGLRYERIHGNDYMPLYAALEERGQTIGFHSTGYWGVDPFRMFDTFLAAHALSFPIYNAIQLVNLVLNGVPERFPKLRISFFEAGAAVIPMLMARLDTVYMMRPSEAPLLKRLPSEYMRDIWYTVQPIEHPDKPKQLEAIVRQIGASQILYASDYPHWDFDMPGAFTQLGFLSGAEKRDILALNTARAFGLDPDSLTLTDWKQQRTAEDQRTAEVEG